MFIFQFINAYTSLAYIAFFKGRYSLFGNEDKCLDYDGNESDSCMDELSTQLISLLVLRIFIGNFVELGLPYFQSLFLRCWKKNTSSSVPRRAAASPSSATTRQMSAAENECTLQAYNTERETEALYDYLELCIQLGLVTLFAPAFPLAPLIAFFANVVEGIVDAFKMLRYNRKPFYRGAQDLGAWKYIFRFLSVSAVLSNVALILFTMDNQVYRHDNVDASGSRTLYHILIAEHCLIFMQFLLATAIHDVPAKIRVDRARKRAIFRIQDEYDRLQKILRRKSQ